MALKNKYGTAGRDKDELLTNESSSKNLKWWEPIRNRYLFRVTKNRDSGVISQKVISEKFSGCTQAVSAAEFRELCRDNAGWE